MDKYVSKNPEEVTAEAINSMERAEEVCDRLNELVGCDMYLPVDVFGRVMVVDEDGICFEDAVSFFEQFELTEDDEGNTEGAEDDGDEERAERDCFFHTVCPPGQCGLPHLGGMPRFAGFNGFNPGMGMGMGFGMVDPSPAGWPMGFGYPLLGKSPKKSRRTCRR